MILFFFYISDERYALEWQTKKETCHKGIFPEAIFGDPELITRGHFCHMVIFLLFRRDGRGLRAQTPKEGISKKESRFAAIYGF